MTAIAGFWRFDGKADAAPNCRQMLASQSIYGPDDSASWDRGEIALGRCLSENLPEDRYDRQPLVGGNGRFALVADLRLDNRQDLIRELGLGPEAAQLADADILLSAWERWQDNCLDHLVGDYAFALWDSVRRQIVLARDPFGTRPLHLHRGKDFFAFASMPKGLHALPEIPRAPDQERTTEIFALIPEHGPRSFFKDIERVELGQILIVSADGIRSRKHWRPELKPVRFRRPEDYADALFSHLEVAVRSRLRGSNGRVGAHLSGGLDSSAVAAMAARILAPENGRVIAFTSVPRAGFDGPDMRGRFGDEGPLAAATAALYPNMTQVLVRTSDHTPLDNLDRNFFLFERPIVNICNQVWYDAMNGAAKTSGLNVMLGAPMANLSMSYDGKTLLPRLLGTGHWLRWLSLVKALSRNRGLSLTSSLAVSLGPWIPAPLWQRLRRTFRGGVNDVAGLTTINMETFRQRNLAEKASESGMDLSFRPKADGTAMRLWAIERTDLGNYFKGWLGGWGLDVRDPSADRRLVEFCLSVPEEQFIAGGVPRSLARRAFASILPEAVLTERRRGLQTADWYEGATRARSGILAEIARLSENTAASTALDLARMRALTEDWPLDGWEREDVYSNYRLGLLRGISAGHFLRKASGGNA